MAFRPDYQIYQDCLIHCHHGFPQWRADPGPSEDLIVKIGDVGYCSEGKFKKLMHLDLRGLRDDGHDGIESPTEVRFPDGISYEHKKNLRVTGGAEVGSGVTGLPVGGGATGGVQNHRREKAVLQLQDEKAQFLYLDKRSSQAIGMHALNHYQSWLAKKSFQGVSVDDIVIIMGTYMTRNWGAKTFVLESNQSNAGGNVNVHSMLNAHVEVDQGAWTRTNDGFNCGHLHPDTSRDTTIDNLYFQYCCTKCDPPLQNQCIFLRTGRIREVLRLGKLLLIGKLMVTHFLYDSEGRQEVMERKASSGKSDKDTGSKGKRRQDKPKDHLELVDSDIVIPDVGYCAVLYDEAAREKFKLVGHGDAVFVTDDDVIHYLGGDPDADKGPGVVSNPNRIITSETKPDSMEFVFIPDGLQKKLFDTETVYALLNGLTVGGRDIKLSIMKFLITAVPQEGFGENAAEMHIFSALLGQLTDYDWLVRSTAVEFFTAAAYQDHLREKIFDRRTVTSLLGRLADVRKNVRSGVVRFIIAAASQDGLREQIFEPATLIPVTDLKAIAVGILNIKSIFRNRLVAAAWRTGQFEKEIFDPETVSALLGLLTDDFWYVRSGVVEIFIAVLCKDFLSAGDNPQGFERDDHLLSSLYNFSYADIPQIEIFRPETVSALANRLDDDDWHVRCRVVEFFRVAISQAEIWMTVYSPQIFLALQNLLSDEYPDVRSSAVEFFGSAVSKDGLREDIFAEETIISALLSRLTDNDQHVRSGAVKFFTAATSQSELQEDIFTKETISALLGRLTDSDRDVRLVAVKFFTAAAPQDGLEEKIFDMKTLSALLSLLTDEHWNVRFNVAEFFLVGGSKVGLLDKIFDSRIVHEFSKRLVDEKNSRVQDSIMEFLGQGELQSRERRFGRGRSSREKKL